MVFFLKKYVILIISVAAFLLLPLFIDKFIMNKFVTNWELQTWAGFLGSYLGGGISGIITLGGVWWQVKREDKKEKKERIVGVLKGILYSLNKNLTEEENEGDLEKRIFQSFYFLDYYYDNAIYSAFYDSYIYEIFPEIIKENYKIIFEIDFGKEIIDLNELVKNFNINHKFLSLESKNRKNILENIEKETLKIKIKSFNETEDIKNLKRLGTDYEKILILIKEIRECSKNFSILNTKNENNRENFLKTGKKLHNYLDQLWGLLINCEDKELKESIEKLGQYFLAEEVLLSEKNNIFTILSKMLEVKGKIENELKKIL